MHSLSERVFPALRQDIANAGLFFRRGASGSVASALGDFYAMQHVRTMVLRAGGMRLGKWARIRMPIHVERPEWFSVGDSTFINRELYVDNTAAPVFIGKGCVIGFRVSMTTSHHDLETKKIEGREIVIGDGVWIGACATILPGVNIGDGAIVASGAVVAEDVEPFTLAGGVPAKAIKKIKEA